MADYDTIVIGSGAGGLTAALALARAGQRVLVLEQHYLPGGWCHTFNLGGYDFSPGVHYIGELQPGGRMREVYEGLGVADDLVFLELNPDGFDQVRVGRDFRFDIPRGRAAYQARLCERFPHQADAVGRWLDLATALGDELQAGIRADGLRGKLTLPFRIPNLARFGLGSLDRALRHCGVTDPLLHTVLTIQAGDHGLPADRAPAALHAAVVSHYFAGAWYPRGGARSLPKAFLKGLRRHGGEIRVRTRVDEILVERKGGTRRAVGVRLADGSTISADTVISNADPAVTFGKMVAREHLSRRVRFKLDRTRWSVSAISLFLAADIDPDAHGLDSGNTWYSRGPDTGAAYRYAASPAPLDLELPGAFLTVTTLKDPSKRRDGVHTLEAFSFVSHEAFSRWADSDLGERPSDYVALKDTIAARMLATLEDVVPGLADRIVFQEVGTPLTNTHYCAATEGSLYGTEKSALQVGPFAWGLDTAIEGLKLCGASTIGHGVAGATFSGIAVAQRVLGCSRRELLSDRGQTLRTFPCDDIGAWPASLRPRTPALQLAASK